MLQSVHADGQQRSLLEPPRVSHSPNGASTKQIRRSSIDSNLAKKHISQKQLPTADPDGAQAYNSERTGSLP